MDGGRRLLQSMKEALPAMSPALQPWAPAYPFAAAESAAAARSTPGKARVLRPRPQRRTPAEKLLRLVASRGVGLALAGALLGGAFVYGSVQGGQYEAFVAQYGSPADLVARGLGFGLESITITGSRDLFDSEILQAAGVNGRNSLPFLNASEVRDRLKQVPLVREASVRKYYPDRLVIEITEREPYAIWQMDGTLMVIAADGKAIEQLRDDRFNDLPFVAGAGANERVAEFQKIIDAAPELRTRVRAGVLVGERRWNIKMTNGLDVKLPESDAEGAFAQFAKLVREARLLDRDLIYVDLRTPGRMFARMTEEAAAARAESMVRKKGKGGQS